MAAFTRGKDILALPAAQAAVMEGNVDSLLQILDDITDKDVLNEILYVSAKHGQTDCVKVVLSKGGEPSTWIPEDDETVLSIASHNGHLKTLELLLEHGCNVNVRCNGEMHTAVHSCTLGGSVDCLKILLQYKADPNIKDCFAQTALMKACKAGHTEIVALLLENGAKSDMKNIKKENAFLIALYERNAECVKELLLARPEFCVERTPEGLLPLTHAIKFRDAPLVKAFCDAGCNLSATEGLLLTPIQLAIETGHIPTIKALIQGGCNVNAPLGLPSGSTPLMLAVCKGRADIVDALITGGCDLDTFDRHGRTALYFAVKHGYLQCVHKLLKAGADPDINHYDEMEPEVAASYNPLQCAILANRQEETMALIQSGCNLFQGTVYEISEGHGAFTPIQAALGRESRWAVRVLSHANPAVVCTVGPYIGHDEEIKYAIQVAMEQNRKHKTLKITCRNFIRSWLGNKRLFDKVPRLSLPLPLEDYVLFRDLEYLI